MRATAIDIGTNTTLALLAESSGGELRVLRDSQTPNRLGESLRGGSELSAHAIALNVDLLGEILRDYRREGSEQFAVCGTSALRLARNRDEFVQAVHDVLNLDVEVLSGTTEATLTFAGAVSSMDILPHEKTGVIDLGGGSSEVIEGRGHVPEQSCSVDFGAVYLTNEYYSDVVPSLEDVAKLSRSVGERLVKLLTPMRDGKHPWLLVGGTAVTLAMLKLGLKRFDPRKVSGTTLTREDLDRLSNFFLGKHPDELQSLPGMPLERGQYILAGTLLMIELFAALNIHQATVTERGLRHGLWLAKFREGRSV